MAAPQVAGAAALLLAAYAAGGANVTGRGLEVKALLLATVQRVPGMAHKVRGCIVALTLNLTPRPEGLSSCQRCPGAWQRLRAWRAAAAAPRARVSRAPAVAAAAHGRGLARVGRLTAHLPRLRSRHGSASPQASLSVARGPEVSSAGRS